MRIAVLGAVCYDEIFPVQGGRRESFGGILYNTAAFSSVLDDDDRVVPVSNLGEDRYDAALAEFTRLPRVDTSALAKTPGPLMHVTLDWKSPTWRDETVRHQMPPFDMPALEKVLDCDAAHINFIHGTEISAETLDLFWNRFQGLLSLDVHNIISRFDEAGGREIAGFKQWREWTPHLDVVQCNEFEIATMLDGPFESRADYAAAAKEVCQTGPRAVSITLGREGAIMVHRKDDAYYCVDIGVLPPVEAVDTTGCGDSYSAGFMLGMLRFGGPATAVACASVVAGVNARYAGISRLPEAKELLQDPRSHFTVYQDKPADWPGERL